MTTLNKLFKNEFEGEGDWKRAELGMVNKLTIMNSFVLHTLHRNIDCLAIVVCKKNRKFETLKEAEVKKSQFKGTHSQVEVITLPYHLVKGTRVIHKDNIKDLHKVAHRDRITRDEVIKKRERLKVNGVKDVREAMKRMSKGGPVSLRRSTHRHRLMGGNFHLLMKVGVTILMEPNQTMRVMTGRAS